MDDLAEQAFRKWQAENEELLLANAPSVVGQNGAASNYDYWCRQVYTGRIALTKLSSGTAKNLDDAIAQVCAEFGGNTGGGSDGSFCVRNVPSRWKIVWLDNQEEIRAEGLPTIAAFMRFEAVKF